MDILAHGLWAAAAAKAYNLKTGTQKIGGLNPWRATFWGVFPDLFAFTIPFAWLVIGPLVGDEIPHMSPPEEGGPPPDFNHWAFRLASTLYNYSHSIIVFSVIILLLILVRRVYFITLLGRWVAGKPSAASPSMVPAARDRAGEAERPAALAAGTRVFQSANSNNKPLKPFPLELLGWPLHILIDIPTHSYEFYPTPFLWPISDFKIDGLPWSTPWFFIATYTGLTASFLMLWLTSRKQKKMKEAQ